MCAETFLHIEFMEPEWEQSLGSATDNPNVSLCAANANCPKRTTEVNLGISGNICFVWSVNLSKASN